MKSSNANVVDLTVDDSIPGQPSSLPHILLPAVPNAEKRRQLPATITAAGALLAPPQALYQANADTRINARYAGYSTQPNTVLVNNAYKPPMIGDTYDAMFQITTFVLCIIR
jgi:hypothetical protein